MKKNKITLTRPGIKKAIKNELKEWDCIQTDADLLGITEQVMNIIEPLIPTNASNSAQKTVGDRIKTWLQDLYSD